MLSRQELSEAVQERQEARGRRADAVKARLAIEIADHVLAEADPISDIRTLLVKAAWHGLAADPELALDE